MVKLCGSVTYRKLDGLDRQRERDRERERDRQTDRQTENEIEKSHKKLSNKSDRMRISKLIKRQHKKELRNNEKIN